MACILNRLGSSGLKSWNKLHIDRSAFLKLSSSSRRRGMVSVKLADLIVKNAQDVAWVLLVLGLTKLFDLVKSFEKPISLVIVQRISGPGDFTAWLVVVAAVNGSVLALADAVVMFDEAHVKAAIHHGHLGYLISVSLLLVFTCENQVILFIYSVLICWSVHWNIARRDSVCSGSRLEGGGTPSDCTNVERLALDGFMCCLQSCDCQTLLLACSGLSFLNFLRWRDYRLSCYFLSSRLDNRRFNNRFCHGLCQFFLSTSLILVGLLWKATFSTHWNMTLIGWMRFLTCLRGCYSLDLFLYH